MAVKILRMIVLLLLVVGCLPACTLTITPAASAPAPAIAPTTAPTATALPPTPTPEVERKNYAPVPLPGQENQGSPTGDSGGIDLYATAAPEFPPDLEWLNTDRPLTLAQLRGKVVLLDFWTYGCINCIHNFPELKRLQERFPDELVIIGIHSAKFTNEGQTENLRQVILRYDLEHPIINDHDLRLWEEWNVPGWPTLVLIDPSGNIASIHVGEDVYRAFQPIIRLLVEAYDARGKLDRTPLALKLEKAGQPQTVLSFPGKVLADEVSNRLFIADTDHNRIVVADVSSGEVLNVIGSGLPGLGDGDLRNASLRQPQGMALSADGQTLYVADTGNHAIRRVDLAAEQVLTIAGTGKKLQSFPPQGGLARQTDLNSPWDLALADQTLYVAMAGVHQIWALDLTSRQIQPLIGDAYEGTQDGPLATAQLAQPSGLTLDANDQLYFADSEASTIRLATVASATPLVTTIAGAGRTLFNFGDVDGVGEQARLQHPLGVADWQGMLYVADTYNSKIKRVDPMTQATVTLFGGEQGWQDGADPRFFEPSGITAAHNKLYVADTNNHAIRVIDLATQSTSTLVLKGIQRFAAANAGPNAAKVVRFDPIAVAAGAGTLVLSVELPLGYKVNSEAPYSMAWQSSGDVITLPASASTDIVAPHFPLSLPVNFHAGEGLLTGELSIVYCEAERESICLFDQVRLEAPLQVGAAGDHTVALDYQIELAP
ncbi:MAG: thioredoxin-like domain-containing protein [Caldilineaceae bacterium]